MSFSLWKKIIFFLEFFIFPVFYSKLIRLNFERIKDIFSENDEEVTLNILKNEIYCNITVGNQITPFYISFDKQLTFITNDNYSFAKYKPSESSTFKKKSDNPNIYTFEYLKFGFNSSDTFTLKDDSDNEIIVENMPFILGTYFGSNQNFQFSGQLGLKKRLYNSPNIFNFIENLKLKKIINSQIFFFKFDKKDKGELLIGSYPHEFDKHYDSKNLIQSSSFEMGTSNDWFLNIKYFFYGDNRTDIENVRPLLSPNIGMIILTLNIEKIIYNSFFKDLIEKKKCVKIKLEQSFYYICEDNIDISKFKNITFRHIGMEYDFIFEAKDLFYHYYDRYFFLISFRDTFNIILGKPFFEKYTLIFNQDSKQIALYTYFEEKKNVFKENIVIPIFLIIILAFIILILIYFLNKYKIRKKPLNEIIEDYTNVESTKGNKKLLEMINKA